MKFNKLMAVATAAVISCTAVVVPASAATTTTAVSTTATDSQVKTKKITMYEDATKSYSTSMLNAKNAEVKVSKPDVVKATYTTKGKIKITALNSGTSYVTLYNKKTGKAVNKFKVTVSKNIFTAMKSSPMEKLLTGPVKITGDVKFTDNTDNGFDLSYTLISLPDSGFKVSADILDEECFSIVALEDGLYLDFSNTADAISTLLPYMEEEDRAVVESDLEFCRVMFPEEMGAVYMTWEEVAESVADVQEAVSTWTFTGTGEPEPALRVPAEDINSDGPGGTAIQPIESSIDEYLTLIEDFNMDDYFDAMSAFVTKAVGSSVYGKKDGVYSLSLDSADYAKLINKLIKESPELASYIDLQLVPKDISSYDTFKYTKSSITCTSNMNIEELNIRSNLKIAKTSTKKIAKPANTISNSEYMAYVAAVLGQ